MPVYNGERYLRLALDALLAQTYRDFTLVISDNASTDATEGICRDYAARDPRIRYVRQAQNLGAVRNINALIDMAASPLFMWHADDDIAEPELLEACVAELDRRPGAVLAYCVAAPIDADGNLAPRPPRPLDLASPDPVRRFELCLDPIPYSENVNYALMRRDVLLRTQRHGPFAGGDRGLAAELALHGPFARIDRTLFRRRLAVTERSASETETYNTGRPARFRLREWRILGQNLRSIQRAPLPFAVKRRLYGAVARQLRLHPTRYLAELKNALRGLSGSRA
jgi:glycosyltransferase involved in cell wall biosynthesis